MAGAKNKRVFCARGAEAECAMHYCLAQFNPLMHKVAKMVTWNKGFGAILT